MTCVPIHLLQQRLFVTVDGYLPHNLIAPYHILVIRPRNLTWFTRLFSHWELHVVQAGDLNFQSPLVLYTKLPFHENKYSPSNINHSESYIHDSLIGTIQSLGAFLSLLLIGGLCVKCFLNQLVHLYKAFVNRTFRRKALYAHLSRIDSPLCIDYFLIL